MKLKSYFATTVEAAMTLAGQELGPDAMLVHTKKTAPECRYLGEYEVVFAIETEPDIRPLVADQPIPPTADNPALDRLADDIGSMKRQIERMAAALGYAAAAQNGGTITRPDTADRFAALVRAGTHAEIAHELVMRASSSPAPGALSEAVRDSLQAEDWGSGIAAGPRIAAFVGPPGCGKSTTLAKIAAVYGVARRVPTQVLTCDVRRIAAAEQLKTLCSILGVGFQVTETPFALEQALAEHRTKSLVLIDTPGASPKDLTDLTDFAAFLAFRPDIEKHLVLPAPMKPDDLSRVTDRYAIFGYTHLAFSKMDETSTYGCILNEAHRTRKPISFLACGQEIPEDLEAAESGRLTELILGPELAPLWRPKPPRRRSELLPCPLSRPIN